MTVVRVGCIQAESRNGQVERNLAAAEPLVGQAVAAGAELLLCPELLAAGYVYHPSIWGAGESRDGPTEAWLREMARRHDAFVGASYLEAEGAHFYNTFALAAPGGSVAGRVRKASLPGCEGWYFKSDPGSKVIACDLGRVAVGICNDNATARLWNCLREEAPDLVLMPHSAPTVAGGFFADVVSQAIRDNLARIAPHYARGFGVPVALVNKAETGPAPSPLPVLPGVELEFHFPGGSMICDADGGVLAHLDEQPAVAVADVTLDPGRKRCPAPTDGYWARPPGSWPWLSAALFRLLERAGRTAYALSASRREAARSAGSSRR
jgi:N-carbamoylputrescine amidase